MRRSCHLSDRSQSAEMVPTFFKRIFHSALPFYPPTSKESLSAVNHGHSAKASMLYLRASGAHGGSRKNQNWYVWRDLNSHAFRHQILSLACLPVPPQTHMAERVGFDVVLILRSTKIVYSRVPHGMFIL